MKIDVSYTDNQKLHANITWQGREIKLISKRKLSSMPRSRRKREVSESRRSGNFYVWAWIQETLSVVGIAERGYQQ